MSKWMGEASVWIGERVSEHVGDWEYVWKCEWVCVCACFWRCAGMSVCALC